MTGQMTKAEHYMRMIVLAAVATLSLMAQAHAKGTTLQRTCSASALALKHPSMGNLGEAQTHMLSLLTEMQGHISDGVLPAGFDTAASVRLAVEDMMAFNMQAPDIDGMKRTLQTFVEDVCE
jgi:hypothetical protein